MKSTLNGRHLSQEEIASELNNLLHIISSATALIENIGESKSASGKYFTMLRETIARAAEMTTDLVQRSGGVRSNKIVLHPEFANRLATSSEPPVASAVWKPAAPKPRLMVVDDEKMLLILTAEILRDEGYEVVTAKSGFECLELFRNDKRKFDLVLLDLNMPLMDGEETFQRLRAIQPDVRVMLCTGYVHQTRLNHMLAAGLCGFVQKPLGPQQYLSRVRAALAEAAASHCVNA